MHIGRWWVEVLRDGGGATVVAVGRIGRCVARTGWVWRVIYRWVARRTRRHARSEQRLVVVLRDVLICWIMVIVKGRAGDGRLIGELSVLQRELVVLRLLIWLVHGGCRK